MIETESRPGYHRRMGQTWVTPVTLTGQRVRMEPLADRHLEDLARVAFDDAIWRWTITQPIDDARLRAWIEVALANAEAGTEVPFATIDIASSRAIGSSRYMTIVRRIADSRSAGHGSGPGSSGLAPTARRSCSSSATRSRRSRRSASNSRPMPGTSQSRTALLGIGATFEGVHRRHTIMPDGSIRDSAYFSVIAPEWPAVKARLEGLLAR